MTPVNGITKTDMHRSKLIKLFRLIKISTYERLALEILIVNSLNTNRSTRKVV